MRTVSQIPWLVWCHSHLLSVLSYAVVPLPICLPWIPASFPWFLLFFWVCGFFCAGFVFFLGCCFVCLFCWVTVWVLLFGVFFFHLTGGSACDLYCKGFEAQMLHIKVVFKVISDTGLQAPVTLSTECSQTANCAWIGNLKLLSLLHTEKCEVVELVQIQTFILPYFAAMP